MTMKKNLAILLFTFLIFMPVASISAQADKDVVCSTLQKDFLTELKEQHTPVSIFLINGMKLQGRIADYDCDVIKLTSTIDQMVYTHSISTIVPATPVE